ncbi:bifunctional 2-C-methyl-D-erythritol 4-phosphate cytidylyltransferase/2-C-methyl-D-erythritol 2,4-cyclodiphosphate synthase [Alsobacter sp. SYSU M60028]|uniref:Bifunctional enzyme IspD/IspF n=1 Tax=Alsobacter ponti TaxID=2962936 RepID=A0ABT1LD57_9HYPH|nr:bifunctional 2-C-methyl-D-erythritol 4-phosphate cytidylyltransferase/2-C-methyl-D-erythritol 2,4-cyclodiphosphate synthase [Alsobacter ponti]MCP8938178.1 bifunctional 2-C-methyl-D-erythritol 4-phosphate cytidylyltransferase/2-C-methyl-D-erythritol 2,4-cyclodiphosphate synthase [Alsobacter ponti]
MSTAAPSSNEHPTVAAVIVAAGSGHRAGGPLPKQYQSLGGETVLACSIAALSQPGVGTLACVIAAGGEALYDEAVAGLPETVARRLLPPTVGGATRQASVRAGLEALAASASPPDLVLVHDAARPFVSAALVDRAINRALAFGAAVPGVPVVDTVKRVDGRGVVVDSPERGALRAVQTPQAFRFAALLDAHRRAAEAGRVDLTDDAAVMEWAGHEVHVFDGEPGNVKLTTAQDMARARAEAEGMLETRVGAGYDVHAFTDGDAVMLGGVRIPHDRALAGHSDADVVLHALTDAVLGALADGDIGAHFPPSDPQWRGASSDRFLAFAVERVRARGGRILHLDCTVVCEAPKVGPHRDAMRERIASICGVSAGRVAVKATTSEQLGFTGRREGIAAHATATLSLPAED